ncbi:FG-GAP repeat domain-containing protein, partial [Calditrichota bacterium]
MIKVIQLLFLSIICLAGSANAQSTISFNTKTDFTAGTAPISASTEDLNGDGKSDLVVANYSSNSVSVLLNTTTPGSSTPNFSAKTDFMTGTNPWSVALGDLNGDGKPDMAVVNNSQSLVSILLNTTTPGASTPSFSMQTVFSTGTNPKFVSIADLNSDGKRDLAITNYSDHSVSVLLNTTPPGATTPSFSAKTDFTTGYNPESVSLGDLNGDGRPDLAVAHSGQTTVAVLLNTTTPGAAIPTFSSIAGVNTDNASSSVSIGDLNGDGKPDLAVTNSDYISDNNVSVILNTTAPGASTPSFSSKTDFATGSIPLSVSVGDLNGDGKPDLAAVNQGSNSVSVFTNITTPGSSTPSFSTKADFTTGSAPRSISIEDLNGDGLPDISVVNFSSDNVSVFFNTTSAGTPEVFFNSKTDFFTQTYPQSVSTGDLNGDGKPDLVVTVFGPNAVAVLLNTTTPGASTPSLSTLTLFATGVFPSDASIGDLNGDGNQDLAVANISSNNVSVLLNTTAPGATTPSFSTKTDFTAGNSPRAVSIADMNGDGLLDLVVANGSSNSVSVLLNTTTPGATTPSFSAKTDFSTGTYPIDICIKDLNGDGKLDLVTANNSSHNVSILLNTTSAGASTPSFSAKTDFASEDYPNSVSIEDLNGDGKQDIAVTSAGSHSVSVFLNITAPGASTPSLSSKTDFSTGSSSSPRSVAIGDFNCDGRPDLTVANLGSFSVSVLLNLTSPGSSIPSFSAKTDFTAGSSPQFIACADLNCNGKQDLVVVNNGSSSISLFLNDTGTDVLPGYFNTKYDFTTGQSPRSVSIEDFNLDGLPDLVAANQYSNSVSVFFNTATPGATTPSFTNRRDFTTGTGPRFVYAEDINGNGKPDLAVVNLISNTVSVLLNTTNPGATYPSFSSKTDFTTGNS